MRILSNLSVSGLLGLNSVADANTDTDKFLVLDSSGIVKYRTGAELYNDIGAGGAAAYTSTLQHEVKAGVALTKGQAVYVTSADGTNMIVSKASNASEATSSKTLGLIAQNLSVNGKGFVITEGLLAGLDTSTAGTEGDPVWLGTDGNLIYGLTNKPYAPAHLVFIGIVTRKNSNNGEIFVKVQNGFELQELHNVQITSTPADNTVLAYETSTSLYKMKSIPTLLGYTPVTNARNITINGTTYDLSADRSWSVGTHTGSLTSGYIPKANGTTSLTDSLVYDTGSAVLIGTQTASSGKFMVYSASPDNHYQAIGSAPSFRFADTITSPNYTGIFGLATATNHFIIGAAAGDMVLSNNTTSSIGNFLFGTGATERMRINASTGNISINNTNNTYRLDVTGTVRFTGQLRLESTITNGTHTYTLPSATGTLALTTDIPSLSGYVPTSRTLTINGTSFDLSADRSWTIPAGVSSVAGGTGINVSTTSGVATVSNTGLLSATGGSGINVSVTSGALNIVNTGLLSASGGSGINVSVSSGVLNIVNTGILSILGSSGINVSTTSGTTTITNTGILSASGGTGINVSVTSGVLTITNTITNTNQLTNGAGYITGITSVMVTNALGYTPTQGTGTTNYLPKFTGTSTIGDSSISDVASSPLSIVKNASSITSNLIFISPTTGTNASILQLDNAGAGTFYIGRQNSAGNSVLLSGLGSYASVVGHTGSQTLHLVTNAISRVQVDGSGNLGLGVTPSAWGAFKPSLQVGTASLSQIANRLYLTANGYYSGSAWTYIDTDYSTQYFQQNGQHIWQTSVSGTAGNAISFTQAMTLNASGNLSVGNTNDTYKLDVSGTGRFTGALTGTSATFSSTVKATQFQLTNSSGQYYYFDNASGNNFIGLTATNTLGLYVGGNLSLSIASTGAATFSSSVTATNLILGDSNNLTWGGSYGANIPTIVGVSGASGYLAIYPAGSTLGERFRITNGGNVGIGNIGANAKLEVTASSGEVFRADAASGAYRIIANQTQVLLNGNVGIGTTSPTRLFDVSATNPQMTLKSTTTTGFSEYYFSDSAGDPGYLSYAHNGDYLVFGVNIAERMRITSGGNVGIGTTSPVSILNIVDTSASDTTLTIGQAGEVPTIKAGGSNTDLKIEAVGVGGFLQLVTNSNPRIHISPTGNVGIGTTSPNYKLHLNTSGTAENVFGITNGTQILTLGVNNDSGGSFLFENSNNGLRFGTNATERMRITSGGNVGIGCTPNYGKVEIQGATTDKRLYIGTNAFYSNSIDLLGINASGSEIPLGLGGSQIQYYTGASERMRITSGGFVGINNSSPYNLLTVGANSHTSPSDTNRVLNWYSVGSELWNNVIPVAIGNNNSSTSQPQMVGLSLFNNSASNNTWSPAITFGGLSTSGGYMNGAAGIAAQLPANSDNNFRGGNLVFYTAGVGAVKGLVEKMRIQHDGNVGIGTTSPDWLLKIEKNSSGGGAGTYPALVVNNPNAAGYSAMYFFNGATNVGGLEYSNTSTNLLLNAYGALLFQTASGTERMRITSGGNVLIAKTSISSRLSGPTVEAEGTFYSGGNQGGYFFEDRSNSTYWYGWYATGNTNVFFYNGNLGANIATIAPTTGTYIALSDINKKKDFEASTIGLNAVLGLKPTLYRMKKDATEGNKELGFIAQEVKDFIPQAYVESENFVGLNYNAIVAALTKAVQELKQELDTLKNK
jgi:hypothetical protein